jgi:1-acyl-sn-glycerol-3-phosphate acyltransferase
MARHSNLTGFQQRRARVIKRFVDLMFALLTRRTVMGLERLPGSGPCLVVVNHPSRLDPALLFGLIERPDLTALVAAEYKQRGPHRRFVEWTGGHWIQRGNGDRAALERTLSLLEQGWMVGIAPEGRRSDGPCMLRAQPGPAFLAARAQVPVVPIAITGTENVAAGLRRLRRVPVTVTVGQPFDLPPETPGDRKGYRQRCSDEMMCRIAALLPEAYRGAFANHPRLLDLLAGASSPHAVDDPSDDAPEASQRATVSPSITSPVGTKPSDAYSRAAATLSGS